MRSADDSARRILKVQGARQKAPDPRARRRPLQRHGAAHEATVQLGALAKLPEAARSSGGGVRAVHDNGDGRVG